MKNIRHIILGIAAVTSLGMASALHAQMPGQGPGQGPGAGPMGWHGPQGMPGARGPGANFDLAAMVDARLAKAKTALNITPGAQEEAWNSLAGYVKQQAEAMKKVRTAARAETNTKVPQRLEQHVAMAQLHLDSATTMKSKVLAVYTLLSDEQKAIADKMIGRMHRRMGPPAS